MGIKDLGGVSFFDRSYMTNLGYESINKSVLKKWHWKYTRQNGTIFITSIGQSSSETIF